MKESVFHIKRGICYSDYRTPVGADPFRSAGKEEAMTEAEVRGKYEALTKRLIEKGITITTMESCTAGQVASLITDTEGSSAILKGAFITYSNQAKILQGVPAEVIGKYGVYSEQTAAAMAAACRKCYGADIGLGVTGSFGNVDPNNRDSVPGRVFFAIESVQGTSHETLELPPQKDRHAYKLYTAGLIADRLLALTDKF